MKLLERIKKMGKITLKGLFKDTDEIYKRGWKIFTLIPKTKKRRRNG